MEQRKVMGKSVKPLWERLGFSNEQEMKKWEALYRE